MTNITELDTRTVEDINRAVKILEGKLNKTNLSATTRKATEKQIQRLKEQKTKTLNLYKKHKNKNSKLKSLSVSALSVKKIYETIGKTPSVKNSSAFEEWISKPTNILTCVGGTIATIGVLGTTIGEHTIMGWLGQGAISLGSLAAANPAIAVTLGGAGLIAGAVIAKKIHKKMKANAEAKIEAEEEMNKGTAYDHNKIAESATNSATFKELVAQAASDESIRNYLLTIATNSSNNPSTIIQANKILTYANAQIKANEAQATNAILSAHMNSNKEHPNNTSQTIKSAIASQALFEELMELETTKNKTVTQPTFSGKNAKNFTDEFSKSKNDKEMENSIKGKDVASYVVSIIGERPDPIPDTSNPSTITNQNEINEYDTAKKALTELYEKTAARIKYNQRMDSGEFTVDSSGNKYTINGLEFDKTDLLTSRGASAYYDAIIEACENAGINVNTVNANEGQRLESKYKTIIDQIKQDMLMEKEAERTGNVKGI